MPSVKARARFWAQAPFVLPQGLWVRKHAPDVEAARGDPFGEVGAGPVRHLLAIGDSIIAGVGAGTISEALPGAFARAHAARTTTEVRWRAHGRIGARAHDVVRELLPQDDARLPIDLVLISVGVNDVTGLTRTRAFRRELTHLLVHLGGRAPDAHVILAGMPPLARFPLLPEPLRAVLGARAEILDEVLAEVADASPGVTWVKTPFHARPEDFSPDGFHPNAGAVAVWADALADVSARLPPRS